MLRNTFCHIPGIGVKSERDLWESGILSWDDACRLDSVLPPWRSRHVKNHLRESKSSLAQKNLRYFSDLLPAAQHWRLFGDFRSSVAYLDIETNGLGGPDAHITTIALYDGSMITCYVRDENLRDFRNDIREYRLIVTYNGTCFDLPFIENSLGIRITAPHIDLRYILRSLGYTGGLKRCERRLGIDRGELDGLDGYSAVLLWRDYLLNDNRKALETLLAYNIQDVVNLERLMVMAYNMKVEGTPFRHFSRLPEPALPAIPFRPDPRTIEKIRRFP
jgi:uncharacterized protein YprB with RNaseH-like and TPR domain